MPKSGVIDMLAAHRALESLPEVWVELAHARIGKDEALGRAGAEEPDALRERTARMLTPPTAAQTQARLHALLDAHAPAEPLPLARSRRWLYGSVVAMAAAAAVLLFVVPSPQPGLPAFEAGYELELDGALALERDVDPGVATEVPRFRLDRPVRWTVRPAARVTEALDVRAFAQHADGRSIPLRIEWRAGDTGVVEIAGEPRAWGLEAGRWQLTVVVGPPAGLPSAASDVRTDADAPYDVQSAWIELQAAGGR